MKLGIFTGATGFGSTIGSIVADAQQAEAEGFATYAMANIFSYDAIGTLTLVGAQTDSIELMTAVVPTYPRHPQAMAQQALTAQAAAGGRRFVLGIGLSHAVVIEGMYGISFDKPARHMREYLQVLNPLLAGETARHDGDQYSRVRVAMSVEDAEPVSCMVAAMGPVMLRIAGEMTDGTILWMTAAKTVETHIGPRIRAAAADAGRSEPRIVVGLPVMLNSDVDAGRASAAAQFSNYGNLPSYRSMLDTEGVANPEDVALIGTEEALETELRRLRDVGATDFGAVTYGTAEEQARTREFLAALAPEI